MGAYGKGFWKSLSKEEQRELKDEVLFDVLDNGRWLSVQEDFESAKYFFESINMTLEIRDNGYTTECIPEIDEDTWVYDYLESDDNGNYEELPEGDDDGQYVGVGLSELWSKKLLNRIEKARKSLRHDGIPFPDPDIEDPWDYDGIERYLKVIKDCAQELADRADDDIKAEEEYWKSDEAVIDELEDGYNVDKLIDKWLLGREDWEDSLIESLRRRPNVIRVNGKLYEAVSPSRRNRSRRSNRRRSI